MEICNSARRGLASTDLCVEIAFRRVDWIWPDLAERLADFWVKCGLGTSLRGPQGLGCTWVDPYWPQDAFPGLVGPFGVTWGRFFGIFHISQMFMGVPLPPITLNPSAILGPPKTRGHPEDGSPAPESKRVHARRQGIQAGPQSRRPEGHGGWAPSLEAWPEPPN